jgi:transposase
MTVPCDSIGIEPVFLPPYSPDLSPIEFPIELCWSKAKQFLCSRSARTYAALDQALTDVTHYITEDDAWGWFNYCGLFI